MSLAKNALLVVAAGLVAGCFAGCVAGCKGGTTYKDTQETLDRLKSCTVGAGEKDKLISDYEAEIARLTLATGPSQMVVTIEGDIFNVKSGHGARPTIDDATTAAMSQDFLALVSRSRGAIEKCYEQALKKNAASATGTVRLNITATFAATGAFQKIGLSPQLGDAFDGCMRSVASKWQLKAAPLPMTFRAPVSLTPS